jgi:hypothetical protein
VETPGRSRAELTELSQHSECGASSGSYIHPECDRVLVRVLPRFEEPEKHMFMPVVYVDITGVHFYSTVAPVGCLFDSH